MEHRTLTLCQDCGKLKERHAHGLCATCYTRKQRASNPEPYRAAVRRAYARNREANNTRSRAYYIANRERLRSRQSERDAIRRDEIRAYQQQYQQDHASELRSYMREYKLSRKYHITTAEFAAMLEKQRGLCAICEGPQTWKNRGGKYVLVIDHDHETGQVRGLLCGACNTALGHVERAAWLKRALAYIAPPMWEGLAGA